ncbi:type III secretion system export apparatus subunit SctT [Candidatus Hamiltonella defensa]|uniref:type III secretion system export apparatus subunit SctT n=1 Tax=Candidatus Williamhamiltonella defendens TaxID=138072 RepID=UPI0015816AF6|nr:type III secretion system export apparatus subunit SctT [Candidatus Hamiltonella defensa]
MMIDFTNHFLNELIVVLFASARLMPAFFLLPFFSNNVLTGSLRLPITMLVAFSLWPYQEKVLPPFETFLYLGLVSKELLIGVLLAFLISWLFWILHAVGAIIDNQRGATISSSIDPISGVDTSELSNFFNLFAAAVFLQGGGMTLFLESYHQSYQICSPLRDCTFAFSPIFAILTKLMSKSLILASPVIAVLLMTEAILGLLSRFAPQLNAFSIALTVKSLIAFLVIILYFSAFIPDQINSLSFYSELLPIWFK